MRQGFTVGVILPAKGGQTTILLRKNGTVPVLLALCSASNGRIPYETKCAALSPNLNRDQEIPPTWEKRGVQKQRNQIFNRQ
jgi:hypothetical protein